MSLHRKLMKMGFLFREDLYVPGGDKQYEKIQVSYVTGEDFLLVVVDYDYCVSINIKSLKYGSYDKVETVSTPQSFIFFRKGLNRVINKLNKHLSNIRFVTEDGYSNLEQYKKEKKFQKHFDE